MEQALLWARGPFFRFALAIMILGLLRVLVLNAISTHSLIRKSKKNSRKIPYGEIILATLKWMIPVKKGLEQRAIFSLISMLFHAAIIVTPIFLGAHIMLWERGLGIAWPALNATWADYLTLLAIVTGLALFVERIRGKSARAISRPQDYFLPLLIVVPFITGYLAMHPGINPFSYNSVMFIHVMSSNLILILLPFTKLSHVALFPTTQLVSELGWHLDPDSGRQVMIALGKEEEAI